MMEDLAEAVVSQLREHDGAGSMSILQGRNVGGYLLVTPVTRDGKTSFDVRNFISLEHVNMDRAEGVNFATSQQTAKFMQAHADQIWSNATYIRFVETPGTQRVQDGPTHICIQFNQGLDCLVKILDTLVFMRPLQHCTAVAEVEVVD